MTCQSVTEQIPLYLYGEVAAQAEEEIEAHLHQCPACRAELEVHRRLHAAVDLARVEPAAPLLLDCRRRLFEAAFDDAQAHPRSGWSRWLPVWRPLAYGWGLPAGALALLAVGFFSARLTMHESGAAFLGGPAAEPVMATVRSVQPDASGQVQISFDETRRRLVTGSVGDGQIEKLLLSAARNEANAGLRVETLEILKGMPASDDIRGVLIGVLAHDPNPGVRLKALEALKPLAAHADVRKTLAQALMKDDNAFVRIQAIDLLVQQRDSALVGVLQNLVRKEQNSYVRQRCQKTLEEMNASIGTF
jgi:anti-sigma factor RsiW